MIHVRIVTRERKEEDMPVPPTESTIVLLLRAGYPLQDIRDTIPDWWVDEAEASRAARLELLFLLAKKFDLMASALVRGKVEKIVRN